MVKRYQHTQIGYTMIIALAIVLLYSACLMAYLMAVDGFDWIPFIALIIFGVLLVLSATLTVVIVGTVAWEFAILLMAGFIVFLALTPLKSR